MSMMRHEQEPVNENRYDPQTQQKVIALASRLQDEHQETLTARQIEEIGAEVGLEPDFVRQALIQMERQQTQAAKQTKTIRQPQAIRQTGNKVEFWSFVAAFAIPLLWATVAFFLGTSFEGEEYRLLAAFFTEVAVAPMALLLGFLTGKKRIGFTAALTLIVALTPTFHKFMEASWIGDSSIIQSRTLLYSFGGGLLAGGIGMIGAWARQRYFPFATKEATKQGVSRPELLNLLFSLQSQLEAQKQHRAFLSVDVVGSKEMKRDAAELAVEHSFGQYRQWVEEIVKDSGGRMQTAAGDGVMCIFPTDADAVRAARRLQEELPQFNKTSNRLPMPFQIRCGISAGEVAIEEGTPIGHLQSPIIDRAAVFQKCAESGDIVVGVEMAGAALSELGHLAPLPEPVHGETVFSWSFRG